MPGWAVAFSVDDFGAAASTAGESCVELLAAGVGGSGPLGRGRGGGIEGNLFWLGVEKAFDCTKGGEGKNEAEKLPFDGEGGDMGRIELLDVEGSELSALWRLPLLSTWSSPVPEDGVEEGDFFDFVFGDMCSWRRVALEDITEGPERMLSQLCSPASSMLRDVLELLVTSRSSSSSSAEELTDSEEDEKFTLDLSAYAAS